MKLNQTKRIGLGCMNLSHAYGKPSSPEQASKLLNLALDLGYNHFDTAAFYGLGTNEQLIGNAIAHRRQDYFLASKCVLVPDENGKRSLDGRPERIRQTCEDALKRLKTDFIDLYYLHRYDKKVPLEDSVGAMSDLVAAGKIGAIGLSEVSAATLRRAHAVHPVSAVQTEYSLWTRNADIAVMDTCAELGADVVAFSPLGRGFLTGELTDLTRLAPNDIRRKMPRFTEENYAKNLLLLEPLKQIAANHQVSMAEIALAWVLQRAEHIVAIPGTSSETHLKANFNALSVRLSDQEWQLLDDAINDKKVHGPRYSEAAQADVDTEQFTSKMVL
jgi:hypothetical protein